MKYVQINAYSGGWAPSIVFRKHEELLADGHQSYVFWARGNHQEDEYQKKISSTSAVYIDALLTRLDGKAGFHSVRATKKLIAELDKIDPDVVHLHVLLGYYINIELLFNWLASHRCKVVWTLHDCWAFTGHCIHFSYVRCTQWQTGCCLNGEKCPQVDEYPESWFCSNVAWNFTKKRELFTSLPSEHLSFISPSHWLANLMKSSFLKDYEVRVVPNEIDHSVFRPTHSDVKKRLGIQGTFVVLGVASKWSDRKGLGDFFKLGSMLGKRFSVVVVGLSESQIKDANSRLSSMTCYRFIGLPRTSTLQELVDIYSEADVFFNPTLEDNFPTVNLEAEACGTPVITYDTGGCRETIKLSSSAVVNSFDRAMRTIVSMAETFRNG